MNRKNLDKYDSKIRIRTTKELEIRKHEFLKICYILDKLDIKYFLQTGILLGAIRQNNFIPWDWDIEVSVFADEVVEKTDILINELNIAGFSIDKYFIELSTFKIDFVGKLPLETTAYSIMGWNHDNDKKIFWRKKSKVSDYLFLEMRKIKLFEKYHLALFPPEDCLTYQYGDWQKPLRSTDKTKYLTKDFSGISFIDILFKKILSFLK